MSSRDPRVDAYIAKAAAFARPILESIREQVHAACPDVTETIKWSMPFFDYHGSPLCHMAAFKEHAALGFWKAALVFGGAKADEATQAMGEFGRLATRADLPSKKELASHIRKAMKLNEEGVKAPRFDKTKTKAPLIVPEDLLAGLNHNRKAKDVFDAFTPGKQREYADWLTEAKTEATRRKRLDQALEWIAEGKSRNWKYQNC